MEAYGSLWKSGGLVTQYTTPQHWCVLVALGTTDLLCKSWHLIARALRRRAHAPIPTAEALRDTLSSASAVTIIAVAVALVLIEAERVVTIVIDVLRLRRRLTTGACHPPISGTGVVIGIAVRKERKKENECYYMC